MNKKIHSTLAEIDGLEEEIRKLAGNFEEGLFAKYGVDSALHLRREIYEVQLFSFDDLVTVTERYPVIEDRSDNDYPYEAYKNIDGVRYFTILTEEEYKKATAPTVTNKNSDTL